MQMFFIMQLELCFLIVGNWNFTLIFIVIVVFLKLCRWRFITETCIFLPFNKYKEAFFFESSGVFLLFYKLLIVPWSLGFSMRWWCGGCCWKVRKGVACSDFRCDSEGCDFYVSLPAGQTMVRLNVAQ